VNKFSNFSARLAGLFAPTRENLHLTDEQKSLAIQKSKTEASTLLGRTVKSIDAPTAQIRVRGRLWMLLRLSGTEPLLRLYVEAETPLPLPLNSFAKLRTGF
jgi:phosphomannomutase